MFLPDFHFLIHLVCAVYTVVLENKPTAKREPTQYNTFLCVDASEAQSLKLFIGFVFFKNNVLHIETVPIKDTNNDRYAIP